MTFSGSGVVVAVLVIVIAALVCAALYAVFGKPSSHNGRKRKQQVVNGFRLAGGILLGLVLMGLLVGLSEVAFGTATATNSVPKRVLAAIVALSALSAIALMVQRWAKYFAGWVGYSVLNGLLMVSSGHLVNNAAILVPRWWSISCTILMFTSALVSLRFTKKYKLNLVDKAALITWVLAFTLAVNVESSHAAYPVGLAVMATGCLALLFAWSYYHVANRRACVLLKYTPRHGTPPTDC
jgi:hypothetical protein